MLIGIKTEEIPQIWPQVYPMLERARTANADDFSMASIYGELLNKDQQLWVWRDGDDITAAGTTKIDVYYNKKVCSLPYIGGKDVLKWLSGAENIITAWAKAQGCTVMQGYARRGWLRVLPHWRPVWTLVRKDI